MRIIAGSRARYKLIPPKDDTTRPITDRVKEALFSILHTRLPGMVVADIFCGTGSLGLEAVSRGAHHAILVDMDGDALLRLRQNIDHLKFENQTSVRRVDAYRYGIPTVEHLNRPVDLVFVDPPFADLRDTADNSRLAKLMRKLSGQTAPEALAVVRHETRVAMPARFSGWRQSDCRPYGSMTLTFFCREMEQLDGADTQPDPTP